MWTRSQWTARGCLLLDWCSGSVTRGREREAQRVKVTITKHTTTTFLSLPPSRSFGTVAYTNLLQTTYLTALLYCSAGSAAALQRISSLSLSHRISALCAPSFRTLGSPQLLSSPINVSTYIPRIFGSIEFLIYSPHALAFLFLVAPQHCPSFVSRRGWKSLSARRPCPDQRRLSLRQSPSFHSSSM